MSELWRVVPEFPSYEVSSRGRVRTLQHVDRLGRVWRQRNKKVRFVADQGFVVYVCQDGKARQVIVARLMLSAFVRRPLSGELARHLDDNKRNQSLKNLAWGFPQDNSDDAKRNGRLVRGVAHHNSKLTDKTVRELRALYKFRSREFGIYGLARRFGLDPTTIWAVVRRGGWRHVA